MKLLLKSYKFPGTDQILAKLIEAGGETLCCRSINSLMLLEKKEELPQKWKESLIIPVYKKGDKTDSSNYRGIRVSLL
jgi:hypothetical protein